MRSARISRRQAEAMCDGLVDDYDVLAVQEDIAMLLERDEIDRYLDDVERSLEQEAREAHDRVPRFNDRPRAERAHRRADRAVLRALPSRVAVPAEFESEAA